MAQARLRHAALEVVHAAPDNASAGADAEAHAMLERIITQGIPRAGYRSLFIPAMRGESAPARRADRAEPAPVPVTMSPALAGLRRRLAQELRRRRLRPTRCPSLTGYELGAAAVPDSLAASICLSISITGRRSVQQARELDRSSSAVVRRRSAGV